MSIGGPRLGGGAEDDMPTGPTKPTGPEAGLDVNEVLENLRFALELPTLADKILAVAEVLSTFAPVVFQSDLFEVIGGYLESHLKIPNGQLNSDVMKQLSAKGLYLYLTLALREGFNWQKQLETAINTIRIVNKANPGLNLATNYTLPQLIEALVAQNDPTKFYKIIELMQYPTLVVAPKGLSLNHFIGPLTHNGEPPFIFDAFQPNIARGEAAVYLIDAGCTYEMGTQPEAVQAKANGNDNGMNNQELRDLMRELGMGLDEHGWGILAVLLGNQDPPVILDERTYAIFNVRPDDVVLGFFYNNRYYFSGPDEHLPYPCTRIRSAVMAEV